MGNITVAVLGALGYSGGIGKKGTSTDITLYDLKKGEDTVTFIEPTRYPERLAPLFYACSLASKALIVVDELDAQFGEQLVMLQCCGIQSGYFVLRNYISKEKIEPLIKGTCLENFDFLPDDPNQLREKLLVQAAEQKSSENQTGTVPVDHAFNVKGVGVVVLGIVISGAVRKHATLNVLPGAKTTQIRSIQKHDDEFDVASLGDRVGLALKNINAEDLDRGVVLTNDPVVKTSNKLQVQALLIKYWPTPIKEGMVMHIGHWAQFLTAKVEVVSDAGDFRKPSLTLSLDKSLAYRPGDTAVLMYLEGAKLRVTGTVLLA
ncbi:MAG: elongation factor Tu [Nitrososphaerota archaeon]|jgi:selenocysteine-specific translation elongation factor|nr:elongation factor Tu [Nitrososphaerota archaeon]